MNFFQRVALCAGAGLAAGLTACSSNDEPAASVWVLQRADLASRQAPPAHVPLHTLDPGSVIRVRAITRLLMERGEEVRARGAAIMDREVDTGAFLAESLRRGAPPESGSR